MDNVRERIEEILGAEGDAPHGSFIEGLGSDEEVESKHERTLTLLKEMANYNEGAGKCLRELTAKNELSPEALACMLVTELPYDFNLKKKLEGIFKDRDDEYLQAFNTVYYLYKWIYLKNESADTPYEDASAELRTTEQYARRYEEDVMGITVTHRMLLENKDREIQEYLAEGKAGYPKISQMVNEMPRVYDTSNDFMEIGQMVQIYDSETEAGLDNVIFDIGRNLDGLLSRYRQYKYMLFRTEFEKHDDDGDAFCNLISEDRLSTLALLKMMDWDCMDKFNVCLMLTGIFIKHNMPEYARDMLIECKRLKPERQNISVLMNKVNSLIVGKADGQIHEQ